MNGFDGCQPTRGSTTLHTTSTQQPLTRTSSYYSFHNPSPTPQIGDRRRAAPWRSQRVVVFDMNPRPLVPPYYVVVLYTCRPSENPSPPLAAQAQTGPEACLLPVKRTRRVEKEKCLSMASNDNGRGVSWRHWLAVHTCAQTRGG